MPKLNTKRMNQWGLDRGALRPGTVVHEHPNPGEMPALAYFDPRTFDIYIDPREPNFKTQRVLKGILVHEGSHSMNSLWLQSAIDTGADPACLNAMKILEEARIEYLAVNNDPVFTPLLRAVFNTLLRSSFTDPAAFSTVSGGITAWALFKGRAHSRVINTREAELIDAWAEETYGEYAMQVFDDLLGEFTTLDLSTGSIGQLRSLRRAIEIGDEWVQLVKDMSGENGEQELADAVAAMIPSDPFGEESPNPEDGESDGSGSGGESEDGESEDGESEDGESGGGDDSEDGEDQEAYRASGGQSGETDPTESDHAAAKIFDEASQEVSGTPDEKVIADKTDKDSQEVRNAWSNPHGKYGWTRKPATGELGSHTENLRRTLEEMTAPSVTQRRGLSEAPPGRLNGRGAMAASADRAAGRITAAKPWKKRQNLLGENPPVIVGFATDTSGSMSWATDIMGEMTYIVSRAVNPATSKLAAVTFGDECETILRPGEMLDDVPVRQANSGTEEFDVAMAALDNVLGLSDQTVVGRKILIIVSDGDLVGDGQSENGAKWMEELSAAGVEIFMVGAHAHSMLGNTIHTRGSRDLVEWVDVPYGSSSRSLESMMDILNAALKSANRKATR